MNENLRETPKQRVKQDNGSKINAAAPQRQCPFLNLSEDVLLHSFEWLDFQGTTRLGTVSKRLLDLSKNARVYRHLCELGGITSVHSLTSYRETFLRNYRISPALVLAVNEYKLYAFPTTRERKRAKVDVECILPRITDLRMKVRVYVHISTHGINILINRDNTLREYNQLLTISLSGPASTRCEADFYRAEMSYYRLVPPETLSNLDTYNLFLSSRSHLSPRHQAMADCYRATMRANGLVPPETLSNNDAYKLFLSSRPHLSPRHQAMADCYRATMRANGLVPPETLSILDAYNLLLSSRPHLSLQDQAKSDFYRAAMRADTLVPPETLSNNDAYNLLLSSRSHLSPQDQATTDCYRATMRANDLVPPETLSNLDAYNLLLSSRPHLSPVSQRTVDHLVTRMQSSQREALRSFDSSRTTP